MFTGMVETEMYNDMIQIMTYYTYINTQAGTIFLVGDGKIVYGIYWKVFKRTPKVDVFWLQDEKKFTKIIKQLEQYFTGKRKVFDFPYEVKGTDFQKKVWKELEKIPYGLSLSYKDIAVKVGKPTAVRAVGTAIGNNPMSIIVPCHRVLTSEKKLGGFAGGLKGKKVLLKREGIMWRE
jgi:methylated-DNA-[protein]-cysteine S-methyltransferase